MHASALPALHQATCFCLTLWLSVSSLQAQTDLTRPLRDPTTSGNSTRLAKHSWQPSPQDHDWPAAVRLKPPPHDSSQLSSPTFVDGRKVLSTHFDLQSEAESLPAKAATTEPQNTGLLTQMFPPIMRAGEPAPSHQVIRSPATTAQKNTLGSRYAETHPPHSPYRQRTMGAAPAMIPQALERENWKAPYSYGYFGATGNRSWSRQHGYRDHQTRWTLR